MGVDQNGADWVGRVEFSRSLSFNLRLVRQNGRLLVDDEICASDRVLYGAPQTSIYLTAAAG